MEEDGTDKAAACLVLCMRLKKHETLPLPTEEQEGEGEEEGREPLPIRLLRLIDRFGESEAGAGNWCRYKPGLAAG